MTNLYDFKATDIDGKEVDLSELQGKVALVVNTASKCGFTPQYEGLEELQRTYDWVKSWGMLEQTESPLQLVNIEVQKRAHAPMQ